MKFRNGIGAVDMSKIVSRILIVSFLVSFAVGALGVGDFAVAQPSTQKVFRPSGQEKALDTMSGEGLVFEKGKSDLLFRVRWSHSVLNGIPQQTTVVHADLSGQEASRERANYENGSFSNYQVQNFQRGIEANIKVENGKVLFYKKENGKVDTAEDVVSENLVVGPTLFAYFQQHLSDLDAGKKLPIRMAVYDHTRVINFEAREIDKNCLGNGADLCIEMVVSNFFLKALVGKSTLTFKKMNGRIMAYDLTALSLVRKNVGGKLESFVSRVEYR